MIALASYLAAAGLWFVMFSPLAAGAAWFWPTMVTAATGLAGVAIWQRRGSPAGPFRWRWLAIGVASAAVLYGVFLGCNAVAGAVLGDAARRQVGRIYAIRGGLPPAAVVAMLLVIGPCEEIYWRGFLQRRLAERLGPWGGMVAGAVLYTAVHLWAGNFMLLGAAGVCGLFWGAMLVRSRSIWPGVICHALWDVAAFVLAPIG